MHGQDADAEPASPLEIRLLGAATATLAGRRVEGFDSPRLQELLARIVLGAGDAVSRAGMAFELWPDSTESQARTNLRHLLHDLRRAIPGVDDHVEITPTSLRWPTDTAAVVDVLVFSAALRRADSASEAGDVRRALEDAVGRYRGPFLRTCYGDWVLEQRERLRQQVMNALHRLADMTESAGELDVTLRYAQELVRHDELSEAAWRRLMRVHRLRGDRAGALRAYHGCVGVLGRELGVTPSAETTALYETFRSEPPAAEPLVPAAAARGRASTLVGRSDEWSRVVETWRGAAAGDARILLVTGEPGIGKTRLLEELSRACRSEGVPVARTRSYSAEGSLAWGPIVDWLRSDAIMPQLGALDDVWLSELARLLPELRATRPSLPAPVPVSDENQRRHLFDALVRAFRAVNGPLLLVLDDVQWCDSDTLECLHFLVRTETEAPILIAATARTPDLDRHSSWAATRSSLLAARRVWELALEPLDRTAVAHLAVQLSGGDVPTETVERLYRETEGNPLFVVEAVRAGHVGDAWKLSPTVRAVVMDRFAQLSEPARRLLELTATVGREFDVDVLTLAGDDSEDTVLDALDELWRRRIVREEEGAYDFSHDVLREAAYDAISPARRRRLHQSVAAALLVAHEDDLGPVSGQLATHYEKAGLVTEAVESHRRAAEHAYMVFANDESIADLRRALSLLDRLPPSPSRDELELELRTALGPPLVARAGYGAAETSSTYERAVQLSRRLGRPASASVLRGLALAMIGGCHFGRSAELGHDLLEQADDPLAFVEGHYVLGVTEFWRAHLALAREHLETALAAYDTGRALEHVARFSQDPYAVCSIRLALVQSHLGHPAAALTTAERALDAATALGHPTTLGYVLNYYAILSDDLGDAVRLRELVDAGSDLWTRERLGFFEGQAPLFRGWLDTLAGDPGGIGHIREGVDNWRHDGHQLHLTYALGILARACLRSGDVAEGRAAVQEALEWGDDHDQRYLEPELHRLEGELLAQSGDRAASAAALCRAFDLAGRREDRALQLRAACSLVRHVPGREARARLQSVRDAFEPADDSADLREADSLLTAG